MRKLNWLLLLVVFAMVVAACGDDDSADTTAAPGTEAPGTEGPAEVTGEVSVFGAFSGIEAAAVSDVIDAEINAKRSYTATYEGSDSFEEQIKIRVEGGNPPDVALYPQPGAVVEQAELGNAIALEDLGFDIAELESIYGPYLISLGEYEGKHYGLPTNVNSKSLIWYPEPAFSDAGYEVPTTWDELIALSDEIVADGNTPWCIGIGSDAATGWPATDWMEDIMLRTAGVEAYDQWVTNDLKFSSPEVTRAAELLGEVAFGEGYVLGGSANIPDIDFRDAPDPMFQDPPACYLHRQASFIVTFFDAADGRVLEFGTDYGVFAFPDIDEGKKGALGAGELAAVFNDTPAVRAFLDDFTSVEVQCAQGSINPEIGRISPNTGVGPECYTNPVLATTAQAIVDALNVNGFRFDASDLMPTAVGSGSFWTGMNEYMRGGPDSLAGILEDIDASWP
jgi:alpha-glucoside transport system substrate-binding protein